MHHVLLIRWGGLGDLMAVLPSIHLVRKSLPSALLTLVAREEYASLLLETGIIDQIVREDSAGLLPLFADGPGLSDRWSEWLGRFELILVWANRPEKGGLEKNLSVLAGAKKFYVLRYSPEAGGPISRFFFEKTLAALGGNLPRIITFDECARLGASAIPEESVSARPTRPAGIKKYVVVHPGSGGEKKRWPVANFLEIVRRLRERGVPGILISGEAERGLEPLIGKTAGFSGWNWLRSPSLKRLSQILADADLYLGNDSGITHLAAACRTEVVAIFRADLTQAWKPYGRVHLLSARSVEGVSVESVWKTVAQVLCI